MRNLINRLQRLMRDDSGQDLLEYALLVALIALVAVVAVTNSGKAGNSIFSTVATQLQNAANAASYAVSASRIGGARSRCAADVPRTGCRTRCRMAWARAAR